MLSKTLGKNKEDMTMKKDIRTLATLLIASATFVACSSDDNIANENQQPVNPTGKYTMTINASKGDDATTRALSLDSKTLSVKWANTDKVSVFPASSWLTPLGTLTAAASDNGSTTLTGDLTSAPSAGGQLNLLFPRATWDYTGQTGVLTGDNSIEKKYDYALANVEVASVDGNTITTTGDANFQSQQAIVKFILKNKSDNSSLDASSLTVSAASNKLVTGIGFNSKSTTHSGYTYDGGTSSTYGEAPSNLVDGKKSSDNRSKWCTSTGDKVNDIWYCEFHTESPVQVNGYTITTGDDNSDRNNRNPKDWVLKAKVNSGDSWTTIATVTNDATLKDEDYKSFDFNVDVHGIYQYFRFEVSANQGDGDMQIEELELFESNYGTAYGDLTVTPASATSEMTVALRNENGSADTYTVSAKAGGKKYAFSKDGVTFQNGQYYEITVKMTEQAASTVTWDFSEMSKSEGHPDLDMGYTYKDVTLSGEGNLNFDDGLLEVYGGLTFTAPSKKHFKSIVITATNYADISGWTNDYDNDNDTYTSTWTGDASSVTFSSGNGYGVTSIVFTLE